MANANIDALHAGSLKIKISFFFPKKITFYKWCVTKVAHCIDLDFFKHLELIEYFVYSIVFSKMQINHSERRIVLNFTQPSPYKSYPNFVPINF